MISPQELFQAYGRGENITALLRKRFGSELNNEQIIEIAYDLQAGSYSKLAAQKEGEEVRRAFTREIAGCLARYGRPSSLLDAGTGEATTLSFVLDAYHEIEPGRKIEVHGFDLSWSRIAHAEQWLRGRGLRNQDWCDIQLCTGSLLNIPYADDSFDVVFTSHSVEPNGGREKEILRELYRVASRYLILFEPASEFGSEEARVRMKSHGYCEDLKGKAEELGLKVVEHRLADNLPTPWNPTGITVVEKRVDAAPATPRRVCPKYRVPLRRHGNAYASSESYLAYPIVNGIPCLRLENGVIASYLVADGLARAS